MLVRKRVQCDQVDEIADLPPFIVLFGLLKCGLSRISHVQVKLHLFVLFSYPLPDGGHHAPRPTVKEQGLAESNGVPCIRLEGVHPRSPVGRRHQGEPPDVSPNVQHDRFKPLRPLAVEYIGNVLRERLLVVRPLVEDLLADLVDLPGVHRDVERLRRAGGPRVGEGHVRLCEFVPGIGVAGTNPFDTKGFQCCGTVHTLRIFYRFI
mmetsp:Transcript_32438/g.50202  ORF Transcript_32438/g.50202 Transcript_32438/m.50202 type:complete len:207 (+) Transcript_32438:507-1127(+)